MRFFRWFLVPVASALSYALPAIIGAVVIYLIAFTTTFLPSLFHLPIEVCLGASNWLLGAMLAPILAVAIPSYITPKRSLILSISIAAFWTIVSVVMNVNALYQGRPFGFYQWTSPIMTIVILFDTALLVGDQYGQIKEKIHNFCLLTIPIFILAGILLHLWTIWISFKMDGFISAIMTLILPIVGEVWYFLEVFSKHDGLSPFTATIIIYALTSFTVFWTNHFADDQTANQSFKQTGRKMTSDFKIKLFEGTSPILVNNNHFYLGNLALLLYYTTHDPTEEHLKKLLEFCETVFKTIDKSQIPKEASSFDHILPPFDQQYLFRFTGIGAYGAGNISGAIECLFAEQQFLQLGIQLRINPIFFFGTRRSYLNVVYELSSVTTSKYDEPIASLNNNRAFSFSDKNTHCYLSTTKEKPLIVTWRIGNRQIWDGFR